MSALLVRLLAIEAQYICTAILIAICMLAGLYLYGMRERKTKGKEPLAGADCPVWADFEKRERVSATQVQHMISDEAAVSPMEEVTEPVLSKPKGIVNLDTLSEHYQAHETVTLQSLKEKKLVSQSVNYVKVLARGVLNKPLIVKLSDFSVDAVKMILLTGGEAIRLTAKRK